MPQRVVIVGGGFGGLTVAKRLKGADVDITLIDRTNHHLFQPLLYQVATGGLSPADIASPIRFVLRRQRNVRVIEDTVIDIAADYVTTATGTIPFDHLIVATGATHHYFGNDHWEQNAPGLKTLPDATRLRAKILEAFENAERTGSADMTFLVVGGGPTGVEMAGAIAETARHTLRRDFRKIDPSAARVLLVEAADRILGAYPVSLSAKAEAQLAGLGVEVWTSALVTKIDDGSVTLRRGDREEQLMTVATVWAAGVKASPLGEALVPLGAELDRAGRVKVSPELTVPGHPSIYVIGDLAAVSTNDEPVPGVAPAAMQMGSYVADRIRGRTSKLFRYRNKGNLATIGRSAGIADFGWIRFAGFPAWMAWLGIHIFFLIGFQNRLLVMIQWAWNYVTRNRSARLIVRYDE
ncbi:MAG: NAD(P)/FAD-dependent oxidoreductase [Acidimicrobiia bacterium]|nr:NAD(P)/FAD-dependent oxidoreductase [Acidimicrobiia bacterium]